MILAHGCGFHDYWFQTTVSMTMTADFGTADFMAMFTGTSSLENPAQRVLLGVLGIGKRFA